MMFPYSKWGRTMVVNSLGTVDSSKQENVARTRPNIREALLTALDTWRWNFRSSYICIYGFKLFLTLCQPPVSVLVVDYPGRLYISMWLPARESLGGKNKCM